MTLAQQLGNFEPQSMHKFRLYFDEIGGSPLAGREAAEITIKSTNLPSKSLEEIAIPHGTEELFYAGRRANEPLNVTVRDYVDLDTFEFFENWSRLVHDDATGRRGFRSEYSGTARMQLLDPNDAVVREWELVNIWPQSFEAGEVDYSSSDHIEMGLTLRYDRAVPVTF